MKKIIIGSIVLLAIAGIAVSAFLWLHKPQVILLKDGTKLTLVGVTYGKHHAPPKIKTAGTRNRGAGALDTESNSIVVWIESVSKKTGPNQWPNYQLFVYDSEETACVTTWSRSGANEIKPGVYLQGFSLDAFPRWDRKIILRVGAWNNMGGGMQEAKGQFVISNPARVRSIAKWTPEPVPDTQSDGDLTVTLTKFNSGMPGFNSGRGVSSKDPMNKAVFTAFHCEQKGVAVTNWQVIRIETSDAAGNHVQNNSWSTSRDPNGDSTMTYQYGLWPGQSPWKLRVEMSQTAGFSDDQVWSVTNLPVNPGSQQEMYNYNYGNSTRGTPPAFAETTLNGIHLKIYTAIQFTNANYGNGQKPGGFRVQADKPLDGMQLTLASAADENGRPVPYYEGNSWGGDSRQIQLQNLRNAKSLNVTLALHKDRFVEFTATPAKP